MGDDVTALTIALAKENTELRELLAAARDMLVEITVDVGNLYKRFEAVQIKCDA